MEWSVRSFLIKAYHPTNNSLSMVYLTNLLSSSLPLFSNCETSSINARRWPSLPTQILSEVSSIFLSFFKCCSFGNTYITMHTQSLYHKVSLLFSIVYGISIRPFPSTLAQSNFSINHSTRRASQDLGAEQLRGSSPKEPMDSWIFWNHWIHSTGM